MVKRIGRAQQEMPGDLDNYFDIFVSEMKKSGPPVSETVAEAQQSHSAASVQSDLEPAVEPDAIGQRFGPRDLSSAEREIQKLQTILRNSQPPSPPSPSGTRASRQQSKQGLGKAKACLLLCSMVLLVIGAYELYESCLRDRCHSTWQTADDTVDAVDAVDAVAPLPLRPAAANDLQASYLFRQAVNNATHAAELTQIAQTEADWNLVSERWMEAIRLMDAVPDSSSNHKVAQEKVREYIAYLDYALQRAKVAKLE